MSLCDTQTVCLLLVYSGGLLLSVFGCICIACVLYIHYQHRKYAHIPSPPRDGFLVGHSPMISRYNRSGQPASQALTDLMNEYGPVLHIFFFHTPIVLVCDPAAVKKILMSGDDNPKPAMTNRLFRRVYGARFLGSGLVSQTDPAKHGKIRAMLNPMFTRKHLVAFVDQFNASADVLIEKLSGKADGKTEVAMLDEFNSTTLDVIAKVAFGLDLNTTMDDNSPFNESVTLALKGSATAFSSPFSKFSPLPAARKFRREVRDSIKLLRETGRQCIEKKLRAIERQEEVSDDIFTLFLKESIQLVGKDQIQMEELIDEFVTLYFAGQETTANLLSFCLVELGNHPEIMHRLRTEVESVVGDKDHLERSDVGKLDYMMQVLKETLRLWPPVTGVVRELTHSMTVKGYIIPAGSFVWLNSFAMSRMEEYFHDPLQFDPDRFKASDDKPQYAYFPFSLGTRSCIGQQFALIEARVLLARLLRKFHFDLVPGQGYGITDEITLKPLERCRNYLRLAD